MGVLRAFCNDKLAEALHRDWVGCMLPASRDQTGTKDQQEISNTFSKHF